MHMGSFMRHVPNLQTWDTDTIPTRSEFLLSASYLSLGSAELYSADI